MGEGVKALVNEDTFLWTHCCPWCLLGCENWETFVEDTKCFWTKSETIFCVPDTKFVSATNVARAGKWGNICVGNNVSLFARAFKGLWFPRFEFPFPLTLASPPTSLVVHSSWCFLLLQNIAQNFSLFLPIPVTLGIPLPHPPPSRHK